MPATVKRGRRKAPACPCGCGQATAQTTRLRLCQCQCGRKIRETREWLSSGLLACPCGSVLEPVCLFDRACVPSLEDAVAVELQEMHGRACIAAVKSDAGVLGALRTNARAACKLDGCNRKRARESAYCHVHASEEMPF